MNPIALFFSVVFTGLALFAVFMPKTWAKSKKQELESMFGDGAGHGNNADADIEEHRKFAVAIWLTAAAICWLCV